MDKPASTKDQAIWIAIRILGLIFSVTAFFSIFRLVSSLAALIVIGAPSFLSPTLTQSVFFQTILEDSAIIFIAVYFLFFAKPVHRLINKSIPSENDSACLSELLAAITVRTFGVWFILKGIIKLIDYIISIINFKLIERLAVNNTSEGTVPGDELIKFLNQAIPKVTVTLLVELLIYALTAVYFLKYGNSVIRLLTFKPKSSADKDNSSTED